MKNVENLLRCVSQELRALEVARSKYAQQLAPDFSIFNYIYTDEMMLSRMIADLLNPKGDHAQGHVFLSLFLKQLTNAPHYSLLDIHRAKVDTEVLTFRSRTQRRMDIYLEIPYSDGSNTFGICIENKPYAADQPNQLNDYSNELIERHKEDHWHIVYLTGSNNDPSIYSVSKKSLLQWKTNHLYTKIYFPNLTNWLNQCKANSQNDKVSTFLTAFNIFIQKQFSGIEDMSESKQIIDLILQNQNSLHAAFAISTSLNQAKEHLIELFIQQLHSACIEKQWTFVDLGLKDGGTYCGFEIKFSHHLENIGIGLEFQKSGHKMPIIGTWIQDLTMKDESLNNKIFNFLNDLFNQKARVSKYWPFYIEPTITETEMWLKIQNGEFSKQLIQYFEKIEQGLKMLDSA